MLFANDFSHLLVSSINGVSDGQWDNRYSIWSSHSWKAAPYGVLSPVHEVVRLRDEMIIATQGI